LKFDRLTVFGLALAVFAILGGQYLEGGSLSVLLNASAAVIVIGGTVGAAILQTPGPIFGLAMKMFRWTILAPNFEFHSTMKKLVDWSSDARREGLLGLETIADTEPDEFTRKGLNLLVDGSEPESIRNVLLTDLDLTEQKHFSAAGVFEAMGGYSPTMGIVGAVLGLIQGMRNLSQPDMLGEGIATAFVATVYGVGLANLFFLPIAHKLKHLTQLQSRYREMIIEGLTGIAEGENPRIIEARLSAYIQHHK